MKKLMIAAAIVCAAAFAQAASCSWQCPTTFVASDPTQGNKALTYTWAIVEGASADAFTGVTFDSGVLAGAKALLTGTGSTKSEDDGWGEGFMGTLTGGTAGKYYALLIHNDDYKAWGISDAVLAKTDATDDSGNTLMGMSFTNSADDPWGYDSGKSMVANVADAVPEPTSGLLLLLGVAGLALRRRRA